jgi:CubicO group peptidase (beta-lactamase class C family)
LVEKKEGITLGMLLSHTAGFSYSGFSSKLKRWFEPIGSEDVSPSASNMLSQPLVNQPGSKWEYGISVDWVGEIIMRTSGLSLEDYFQQYIFTPLGIKDVNLFPSTDMKQRLSYMHQRAPDGKISLREDGHPMKWSLRVKTPEDKKSVFNCGGAGCFAVLGDFCKIISMLLNHGKCPKSGSQILQPESVEALFENQIPQFPNFGRAGFVPTKPSTTNAFPEMYPDPPDRAQGWAFLGFLNIDVTPTGRGPRSIWWTGICNLFWWVDPEHGLGGIVGSQIMPLGDQDVMTTWFDIETIIFSSLTDGNINACM